jgi:predicted TIM-barrel fold metal-dependent hydrolase
MSPKEIGALLSRNGITEAFVVSARGILFDHSAGNEETWKWAETSKDLGAYGVRFHPVGTIDLRRFLGYREEIRRYHQLGVRLWRLFPEHQGWDFEHPGFRRVADAIAEGGGTLFVKGKAGRIIAGLRGCPVKLLVGTHFYDLSEVLALWEEVQKFALSMAQFHGPGTLRIVLNQGGRGRIVFGSGTPFFSPSAVVGVLESSDLTPEEKRCIGGATLFSLLEKDPW